MAIIPLGPLTIPSIRKLLISSPGLPGGRLTGPPPLLICLPMSGAKGSRRTIFSRTATGLITAALVSRGMSGFAAVNSLEVDGVAAEFAAAPSGTLPLGAPDVLVAPAVAIGGFDPGLAPEADFGAELFGLAAAAAVAGFAVAGFAVPAVGCELAAGAGPGLGADAVLAVAEAVFPAAVGALVTEPCGLVDAVPGEAGAFAAGNFAAPPGFAGAP